MRTQVLSLLAILLTGCGSDLSTSEGLARLNTPVAQLQRHTVQVVRLSEILTDAEVSSQVEAINLQLQGSFRQDWHIDAIAVAGPFIDHSGLVIYLQNDLPDNLPAQTKNIGVVGYHSGNQAWISMARSNLYGADEWRESLDHETLEMLTDTDAGTPLGNAAANLGLAKHLEICDQVASHRYAATPGGPLWLSDYTLPSAWGLAPAVAPFDHLGLMISPHQILQGGSAP